MIDDASDPLRSELKRMSQSLFETYDSTMRDEVEELQRYINPRSIKLAKVKSQRNAHIHHLPIAKRCKDVLVSAHNTYITPTGQKWFSLRPRHKKKRKGEDRVTRWYAKTSDIVRDELAESNFYPVNHEVNDDRCTGGTGACFIGGDETTDLYFVHVPLGTFAIAEDTRQKVNTLVRRFSYTPQQAFEEWGDKVPEYIKADLQDSKKRYTEKYVFIHLVRPRKDYRRDWHEVPEAQRPYEGYYMDEKEWNIIKTEGYYEFPFFVTRFLRGNSGVYGESPGVGVLPVIKQLCKLDELMDVAAQTAAYPRIFQLAGQNRQIDFRSGGITTISREEAQLGFPREWGSSARLDGELERKQAKEEEIKGAFYVDMLNAISQIEREMTATEVSAREAERILAFSSSFTGWTYEFQGAMQRIIGILLRQGKISTDDAPDDVFETTESGEVALLSPTVSYLGKISQAVELVMQRSVDQVVEKIIQFTQQTGDNRMVKMLKPDVLLRMWIESSGANSDIIESEIETEQREEAEAIAAQQMQQQMQMQQQVANMKSGSDTIKNIAEASK